MQRKEAARYSPAWFVTKISARIQRGAELAMAEYAVRQFPRIREKRPHGLPWPVIISLTSFPPRYASLYKTLRSLLDQTMQADGVILWIAEGDMAALPANVLDLQRYGLTVRTCDDLRSFKKIVPALMEFPDAAIAIADDDVYYAPDWLETLARTTDNSGKTVAARYTLLAQVGDDGAAKPYDDWPEETRPGAGSGSHGQVFPVGIGGVLYPPGSLDARVTDQATFMTLCPRGDDVWLYWMSRRAGSSHRHAGGRYEMTMWPFSQKVALKHHNVDNNGNDYQIRAVEESFGTLGSLAGPAVPRKITVAALTFRRAEGLRTLLEALRHQRHDPARPYELTVVIVDNDAGGSGRAIVDTFAQEAAYRIIYVIEQQQGIPMARNRALDAAPTDTDLFVFIDDDEWPVDDWLNAMLLTLDATGADIVHGPVEPVFASEGNPFFISARTFADRRHSEGKQIGYAASNNVMMDAKLVRAANLRFDERMRFTGGEDYLFFNQAVRRGLKIHWSDQAKVFEGIPASRMTWKWALQRQLRIGNTFAVATGIQHGRLHKFKWLAIGLFRMALGAALLPTIAVSPRYGWRGVVHSIRGAGIVVGLLGLAFEEYAPSRLASKATAAQ